MCHLWAHGPLDTSLRIEHSGLELWLKGLLLLQLSPRCLTWTWAFWATAGPSLGSFEMNVPYTPLFPPAASLLVLHSFIHSFPVMFLLLKILFLVTCVQVPSLLVHKTKYMT